MIIPFKLRTEPMEHQFRALEFIEGKPYYALLMEQGTGKTFVEIVDYARRFCNGLLDGALVEAPNGVQANWVRRELPKHWPSEIPLHAAAWYSGANKKELEAMEGIMVPNGGKAFRLLAMNYESLNTAAGFEAAVRFLKSLGPKAGMTGDESQRFKSPSAGRTKKIHLLKPLAPALRSIMSGTPIVKCPWDAFSQFSFLNERILGTTSYWAFKSEYARLLPPGHGLLRHIEMRLRPGVESRNAYRVAHIQDPNARAEALKEIVDRELSRKTPQIVDRDPVTNLPLWRNLDKLDRMIDAWSFRVLKKDCLDLPDKVYDTVFFKMTPTQRRTYDKLRDELRLELESGEIAPVERLGAMTKLSQVTSGYFLVPGTDVQQRIMPLEKNPKVDVFVEEAQTSVENGESVIVWARFQKELQDIARVLDDLRAKAPEDEKHLWVYAEYHGMIGSKTARQEAIDDFEAGRARFFLSQQAAGGTGLTLIAAASMATSMHVIYYSNTFGGEDRWQSEDRAHRIGQEKTVRYTDICAEDSIDEDVQLALRAKVDVAAMITGDTRRAAELLLH